MSRPSWTRRRNRRERQAEARHADLVQRRQGIRLHPNRTRRTAAGLQHRVPARVRARCTLCRPGGALRCPRRRRGARGSRRPLPDGRRPAAGAPTPLALTKRERMSTPEQKNYEAIARLEALRGEPRDCPPRARETETRPEGALEIAAAVGELEGERADRIGLARSA